MTNNAQEIDIPADEKPKGNRASKSTKLDIYVVSFRIHVLIL
jgi:hypothetical protein